MEPQGDRNGDNTGHPPTMRTQDWCWVLAAVLVALGLRSFEIEKPCFSSDEIYEFNAIRTSWSEMINDPDGFPPLPRILLYAWCQLWDSDMAGRWLSALGGTITVGVMGFLGYQIGGPRLAIWSAWLLSLSPYHIHYCREARPYPFFILAVGLVLGCLLRLLKADTTRNWCCYVAAAVLALNVHYFAVAPLGLAALLMILPHRRVAWRRWWSYHLLLTVCAIPVLYWLISDFRFQAHNVGEIGVFDPEMYGYIYFSLVGGYTIGPAQHEIRLLPTWQAVRLFAPWIAIVGLTLAVLFWQAVGWLRKRQLLVPLWVLLLVPVPVLGLLGNATGIGYTDRYTCWIVLPFVLLLATGAAFGRPRRLALGAAGVLIAIVLYASFNGATHPRYISNDVRALRDYLVEHDPQQHPILVTPPYLVTKLRYYFDPSWPIIELPVVFEPNDQLLREAAQETAKSLESSDSYWLVSRWMSEDDPRVELRDHMLRDRLLEFDAEITRLSLYRGEGPRLQAWEPKATPQP